MNLILDLQLATPDISAPTEKEFYFWAAAAINSVAKDVQPEVFGKSTAKNLEISLRVTEANEIQELNRQYRDKDKPTNVLSFPFELPEGLPEAEANGFLGDLVVCSLVVQQEAIEQNKPELHHWAHMIVHGTLHLLGYDHINDDDAEIMEDLERQILSKLGIPDPYLQTHITELEP